MANEVNVLNTRISQQRWKLQPVKEPLGSEGVIENIIMAVLLIYLLKIGASSVSWIVNEAIVNVISRLCQYHINVILLTSYNGNLFLQSSASRR